MLSQSEGYMTRMTIITRSSFYIFALTSALPCVIYSYYLAITIGKVRASHMIWATLES